MIVIALTPEYFSLATLFWGCFGVVFQSHDRSRAGSIRGAWRGFVTANITVANGRRPGRKRFSSESVDFGQENAEIVKCEPWLVWCCVELKIVRRLSTDLGPTVWERDNFRGGF